MKKSVCNLHPIAHVAGIDLEHTACGNEKEVGEKFYVTDIK